MGGFGFMPLPEGDDEDEKAVGVPWWGIVLGLGSVFLLCGLLIWSILSGKV